MHLFIDFTPQYQPPSPSIPHMHFPPPILLFLSLLQEEGASSCLAPCLQQTKTRVHPLALRPDKAAQPSYENRIHRQATDSGTAPDPFIGGLHEDQAAYLLHMGRGEGGPAHAQELPRVQASYNYNEEPEKKKKQCQDIVSNSLGQIENTKVWLNMAFM